MRPVSNKQKVNQWPAQRDRCSRPPLYTNQTSYFGTGFFALSKPELEGKKQTGISGKESREEPGLS